MKEHKKLIKKAIFTSLDSYITKDKKIITKKALRKLVKKNINTEEVSKEDFNSVIDKLVKKGKLTLNDDDDIIMTESSNTTTDGNTSANNNTDYQADEAMVVDHVKNPSTSLPSSTSSSSSTKPVTANKEYPVDLSLTQGDVTILLFYAYCQPIMTRAEQDAAIAYCYATLTDNNVTGRLRIGREGFNGTLTGHHAGIRAFTTAIRNKYPHIFGQTDFKYVDNQPERHLLKGLKVWPVTEIVTYGKLSLLFTYNKCIQLIYIYTRSPAVCDRY